MKKLVEFIVTTAMWLRDTFPTAFSVGVLVFDAMTRKNQILKKENIKLKLELEKKNNETEVLKSMDGKSDLDVLDDLLSGAGSGPKKPGSET